MVLHSILKNGVPRDKIKMGSEETDQPSSSAQQPVLDLSGLRAQILDNAAIVFDNPKAYFPTPALSRNGCKMNLPASGFHIRIVVKAKTLRTTTHPWYLARAVLAHDQVPGTMVVLFGGAHYLTLQEALEALADKSCEMVEKCPQVSEGSVVRLPWISRKEQLA